MGGGNSGMQGQRADEQGVLHPAWAFGFVLYRGKSQEVDGVQFQNVEEYLRNLA